MDYRFTLLLLTLLLPGAQAAWGKGLPETPPVLADAHSGGQTTVFSTSREAFAKPLANLPVENLRDFTFGNKIFNTNWVIAPASVTTLDGLGPTFNRVSCSGCHFKDGRGQPPANATEPMNSMLLRLSIPGADIDGGPMPHPAYGGQLNDKANPGIPAEGRATITYEEIPGTYADGTGYSLRKPTYHFQGWAFGKPGDELMFSPRVSPAVFGLGLLEAVPEATILSRVDPADTDSDGISGRPNHIGKALGRFGWKANVPTLRAQDAGASQGDLGITTSLKPQENCPEPQEACRKAISGGSPEMSEMQLEKLVLYSRTLAPPARRDVEDAQVKQGAVLFEKSRCASCHTPQMKTGESSIPALAHQTIQPFTDLLLHDMGEGLADGRPDYAATGSEWRTPPLWGLGLVKTVNKHNFLLHDGRARNFAEAILWHGGEAETAKENFRAMRKDERAALIRFLESL